MDPKDAIINKLAGKLAQAMLDIAVLEAQLEALSAQEVDQEDIEQNGD